MSGTFELVEGADDDDVGAVYRVAFAAEPGGARDDFVGTQLATHRTREGFRLIGAFDGRRLVGFVYGYTGRLGQWWPDHVAAHTSAELVDTWVGGHLEVVELAVRPEARSRGIGAALMRALVERRAEPCALLGT